MRYLGNAFSLGMLPQGSTPLVKEISEMEAYKLCYASSTETSRESVTLKTGDTLIVAQYQGSRLPEGCTALPEGACFRWFTVSIPDYSVVERLREYSTLKTAWSIGSDAMIAEAGRIWPIDWE